MKLQSKKSLVLAALAFSFSLFLFAPWVSAQQSSGAIAQGFLPDTGKGEIVAGALVSFKAGDAHSVELAAADSSRRLVGVVDENSLVVISDSSKEVQVVISGTTNVLVSDINGPINASDKVTISPISGVGMLATGDGQVVGTAQANFNIKNSQARTITDSKGKSHTIHIGYVPLQVGVAYYQPPGSNFLPPFIQSIADSVAGRSVSLVRILFCGILLLLGFISIGILIYTSVRSAMTSIGRNPLAAATIRKSLYQVGVVVMVILAGTLLSSYLLLAI